MKVRSIQERKNARKNVLYIEEKKRKEVKTKERKKRVGKNRIEGREECIKGRCVKKGRKCSRNKERIYERQHERKKSIFDGSKRTEGGKE